MALQDQETTVMDYALLFLHLFHSITEQSTIN